MALLLALVCGWVKVSLRQEKQRLRRLVRSERRKVILSRLQAIEQLRALSPAHFWNQLKLFSNWNRGNKPVSEVILDDEKTQISLHTSPAHYRDTWARAFQATANSPSHPLGVDLDFAQSVHQEVEFMARLSHAPTAPDLSLIHI